MKAMVEIEKIVDLLNSLDKKTKQKILEKMLNPHYLLKKKNL